MRDVFDFVQKWITAEEPVVLATVVNTWGSGPRRPGSVMAISKSGKVAGSVSGGCVEGDVIREAGPLFGTNQIKILNYGISNDDAWKAGLTCGGKLEVLLEPLFPFNDYYDSEVWQLISEAIQNDTSLLLATRLDLKNPQKLSFRQGKIRSDGSFNMLLADVLEKEGTESFEDNNQRWFAQTLHPRYKLYIIGASHIAVELVELAAVLDFYTIVVDPRGIFTDPTRFRMAPDELLRKWPAEVLESNTLNKQTFAVLLTHDPKIDDQALDILLGSEVAYIGALGSSRTHRARVERLRHKGYDMSIISRIRGPVGLDIGASTPSEIALSIIAEIVSEKNK